MNLEELPRNKDGKYIINDKYVNEEFKKIASMKTKDLSFIREEKLSLHQELLKQAKYD